MTPFAPLFTTTQDLRKSLTRSAIQRDSQSDTQYFALVRFVALYLSALYEYVAREGGIPWTYTKPIDLIDIRIKAAAKSGLLDLFPTDDSVSDTQRQVNEAALQQAYDYAYLTMLKLNSGVLP